MRFQHVRPPLSSAAVAEIQTRIIDAARRVFAAEGFQAVSMRRLAKEAGCTPMTLYAYFSSKNEVMRHIWTGFFDELFVDIEKIAEALPEPKARLRAMARRYVDYWLSHPDRYRMVFLTEDRIGPNEAFFVNATDIVERFGLFLHAIGEACPTQADEAAEVQIRAEALICGLTGIIHNMITISEYPWMAAERLVDVILDGLLG